MTSASEPTLGTVSTPEVHCSSCPVTKSFSCEPGALEVRVSARKVEKHPSSRSSAARSTPPSKKSPGPKTFGAPSFDWNAQGEFVLTRFAVAQNSLPASPELGCTGVVAELTQSEGVVSVPAMSCRLSPPAGAGLTHSKTRTAEFAPLD